MKTKQHTCFIAYALASSFFSSSIIAQSSSEKPLNDTMTNRVVGIYQGGEEDVFEKVEIEASVNAQMWRKHLEVNLLPVIERAANSKMKPGNYTVNVRFLVERDGSITEVKALNDPGHGLATGCEKVVRTGPRWSPGEIKGKKVRSYHTQPIIFAIIDDKKEDKKRDN